MRVSEAAALSIATYWACVQLISQDLASVPWRHFDREEMADGRERRTLRPLSHADYLLNQAVNEHYLTAFVFKETMLSRVLSRGNAYAEVERDQAGRPIAFWPLDNHRVSPVLFDGRLWYSVTNYSRDDAWVPAGDMLHFRGLGDEICGYSLLEAAGRTLAAALDFDRYHREAADAKKQVMVGGVLATEKKLDEEAKARLRKDFEAKHLGRPNSVVVLEDGMTYEDRKLHSPADAKVIEARGYSAQDITRLFKIPPHKVGIYEGVSNANAETQALQYVVACLCPWATRLEQEANVKLLGFRLLGRQYTRMVLSALMRGDRAGRATLYEHLVRNGVLTPNEARAMEDLNPTEWGDTPFIAAQLNTLERANKAEPVAKEAGVRQPPAPPGTNDDRLSAGGVEHVPAAPAVTPDAVRGRFADAAARLARRDAHRACDAVKRLGHDTPAFREWVREYERDCSRYFHQQVRDPLAAHLDADAAGVVAQVGFRAAFDQFTARLGEARDATPEALANRWAAERGPALAARLASAVSAAAAVCPPAG